ncbi:transglutaminase domain protein [Cellulomonas flavigena DSM 20109]|uniref:Transglutaminase domain protein n=1 Tax=Cellulomonas flavigena (strain ATCC 482 / DSM 20109 / BCRC 11376 / JCM 18109 / NBRC 3775 / NCIMB 8073 / NRS 134) TaxID=446466 RepID=D5ULL3_CELFN|nr:transglutaminase-like domain-containing protein [Cellulomonas flavigena]ADG74055.1 transglutaminase domain protein [Cellulomonas flavigena DSM 20109]
MTPAPGAQGADRGPGAAVTLWAVALLALACVPVAAAFTSPVVLLPLVGVVGLAFAVVALARRLAVPPWATGAAGVTLVLASATSLARLGADAAPVADADLDGAGWRSTGAAQLLGPLADAVARLLTAPRPAAPALAPPVVALVALVALTVALALGRRSAARVAPLTGAVVVYGVALLLTAGAADRGAVGAGLVALAAAGWMLLDGEALARDGARPRLGRAPRRARTRWRSSGVAGLLVVALVSAGGAAAAAAVTGDAFEPRDHVAPPRVPAAVVHPLAELSRWQSDADATVLRVRGTHPGYLTWVTLPDHDGAGWHADLALRPLGTVVEPSLPPGAARGDVDVEVQLVEIAGPSGSPGSWLPATAEVVASDAPGVLADVDAGVLAVPPTPEGRLPEGLVYRVRGHVDVPDPALAVRAGVPGGEEVERYLRLERFPADLRAYAQDVVADASSRLDQAERLAATVRADRELAADAVSGTSYARLREFLFAEREAGGQVGTSEQFAGAFAVLARAVGLPSRVVMGFVVPGGAATDDETLRDVHGSDVRAWAEVYLAGTGWVRFDPAPDAVTTSAVDQVPPEQQEQTATQDDPPPVPEDEQPQEPATPLPGGQDRRVDPAVVIVAAAATLLLAALGAWLAVLGARLLRRGRLRRAGAVGAWQHAADALLLRAGAPAPGETADDLARRMTELCGVPAHGLATAAQAVAFGASPVPAPGAWRTAVQVQRRLRAGAPLGRRLTWWADPAPLRRRAGTGGRGAGHRPGPSRR